MSDVHLRQLRVLHIVSSSGVAPALQQTLLMPLLTRMPKARVKVQVACLAPGAVPAAVLRQNGVPVYDIALSRSRFAARGFRELLQAAQEFRPDVIQAWGLTAQIAAAAVRKRCDWKPRLVWSVANTAALARDAGFIDRRKLKMAAKAAAGADRIVYASEAGASQHRRAGFPEGGHLTVPPGVDATRFKVDPAARERVREQLGLGEEAFVIGMLAPFQPEYDHATFLKAVGELLKTNPNVAVVLAGHGVQKGNGPLMALVGGGTLGTRTQLLGEWSDIPALFNACDLVCSSALNDGAYMTLVMAMLCGVPCVATGIGAQGEVVGRFGIAIEPGSPAAFVKGITRILQLPADKRAQMAQAARKHALQNYVYVRSLQKYLQLYGDLVGRETLAAEAVPTPEVEASIAAPMPPSPPSSPSLRQPSSPSQSPPPPRTAAPKKSQPTIAELTDPDSLETRVAERPPEELPKWRRDQEEQRARHEEGVSRAVASADTVGDVLEVFEAELSKPAAKAISPMGERARGVAEEMEDLLAPEALAMPSQAAPAAAPGLAAAPQSTTPPLSPAPAAAASTSGDTTTQLELTLQEDAAPRQAVNASS